MWFVMLEFLTFTVGGTPAVVVYTPKEPLALRVHPVTVVTGVPALVAT